MGAWEKKSLLFFAAYFFEKARIVASLFAHSSCLFFVQSHDRGVANKRAFALLHFLHSLYQLLLAVTDSRCSSINNTQYCCSAWKHVLIIVMKSQCLRHLKQPNCKTYIIPITTSSECRGSSEISGKATSKGQNNLRNANGSKWIAIYHSLTQLTPTGSTWLLGKPKTPLTFCDDKNRHKLLIHKSLFCANPCGLNTQPSAETAFTWLGNSLLRYMISRIL